MPCYDSRNDLNTSDGREDLRKSFRHNSDVAEMLCTMCKTAESFGMPIPKSVWGWWEEHQIRDAKL